MRLSAWEITEWQENGMIPEEEHKHRETHGEGTIRAIGMMRAFFATLFRGDENNGDLKRQAERRAATTAPMREEAHNIAVNPK